MAKKSKGVIYLATGKKYIEEAINSAASLKKHMPKLPITIFSDENIRSPYFDQVVKIKNPKYKIEDKSENIYKSPYDYTLFLDADTYICDDISELFDLLDRFDIALTHVRGRNYSRKKVPNSFPGFNGGLILFRKSPKIKKFFSEWRKLYLKDRNKDVSELYSEEFLKYQDKDFLSRKRETTIKKGINEQPSLREALYKNNLRIATLTDEYNMRGFGGYESEKVKILHYRKKNFELAVKIINSRIGPRVYLWEKNSLRVFYPKNSEKQQKNRLFEALKVLMRGAE